MGHLVDRCDFIDILEESATTGGSVDVVLQGGQHFIDRVRDVVTHDHEDWVQFREHSWMPVKDIEDCFRAEPRDATYDHKHESRL